MSESRIEFCAPVRIESEMNRREHWAARKARFDGQKLVTRCALRNCGGRSVAGGSVVVTLTRIGPRRLDDDNLAGGFKAVRDEIARWLAVDDGDIDAVRFRYEQAKGRPREYAIKVCIQSSTPSTER